MATSTIRGVLGTWSSTRKLAAGVLLVAVTALAVGTLLRDGSSPSLWDAPGTKTSAGDQKASDTSDGVSVKGDSAAASSTGIQGSAAASPYTPLPLQATVTNLSGLRAGDQVKIAVKAEAGSVIYAVEMRMCKADTVIRNDGDMLPTVSGSCAAHPLSPGASGFLKVPAAPPYQEMVAAYTVGVGTDTFPLDEGGTGSVTCDRNHPCVLAVKYQIPNGFGFRTYPLTFA